MVRARRPRPSGTPDRPAETGVGRRAARVDPALKARNLRHLRRIEGQVRGLMAMIESDRYCADVLTQIAAARESLNTVARSLLRNHLRHCATRAARAGGRAAEEMAEELVELFGIGGR